MTVVAKATKPSLDANQANQVGAGNLYAGENLDAVSPCYIKASDGKVYMSDGAASNEAAKFHGFVARQTNLGEPVTLFGAGSRFKYSAGMTPGATLFIAAAGAYNGAGELDTAATTGDSKGTAFAINATDIVVCRTDPKNG
jgi:hypothetical protein